MSDTKLEPALELIIEQLQYEVWSLASLTLSRVPTDVHTFSFEHDCVRQFLLSFQTAQACDPAPGAGPTFGALELRNIHIAMLVKVVFEPAEAFEIVALFSFSSR
ncbi:hypothetical protein [Brevibacterium casei]|uniref:hypothetical protein n=1 Tax=Brevibacterium casei TaxID=33889 RepID=UPI00223A938B|nr:hypothetical protein [Brevibacterium casei]MCT1551782.1 hypothetical protein [Brevibacterium casei]MCT1561363.1 hypothetical protein [Brevibacterium casei]MCT2209547.1 hypothetical protein [Brevibacterium casei]